MPKRWMTWMVIIWIAAVPAVGDSADPPQLAGLDAEVLKWANACKREVVDILMGLLTSKALTEAQLFDTFYIPIPGTYPQKYHTAYDRLTDQALQGVLDAYLAKSDKLVFVVVVDQNGYLPTHNTRYSIPLTGNPDIDLKNNRTKRIFNDRTGLAAAKNIQPHLLQRYFRDTGEEMYDLSLPIFIRERHWGALRFGYSYK